MKASTSKGAKSVTPIEVALPAEANPLCGVAPPLGAESFYSDFDALVGWDWDPWPWGITTTTTTTTPRPPSLRCFRGKTVSCPHVARYFSAKILSLWMNNMMVDRWRGDVLPKSKPHWFQPTMRGLSEATTCKSILNPPFFGQRPIIEIHGGSRLMPTNGKRLPSSSYLWAFWHDFGPRPGLLQQVPPNYIRNLVNHITNINQITSHVNTFRLRPLRSRNPLGLYNSYWVFLVDSGQPIYLYPVIVSLWVVFYCWSLRSSALHKVLLGLSIISEFIEPWTRNSTMEKLSL